MTKHEELRYTSTHEWICKGNPVTIGITDFAQEQLGDVVFVELPKVGTMLVSGKMFGTVESVKTVSDLYAPVSGKVVEINTKLIDAPELVNSAPYEEGWLLKVEVENLEEVDTLLDYTTYSEQITSDHAH